MGHEADVPHQGPQLRKNDPGQDDYPQQHRYWRRRLFTSGADPESTLAIGSSRQAVADATRA
jgi:hypothetical protein